MRKILFRGRRVDNGKWREGSLLHDKEGGFAFISQATGGDYEFSQNTIWENVEVIPETIGQFTGLFDKAGKEIFEGDVVKVSYTREYAYFNGGQRKEDKEEIRKVSLEHSAFGTISIFGEWPSGWMCEPITVEVIGNSHDNPELLKD